MDKTFRFSVVLIIFVAAAEVKCLSLEELNNQAPFCGTYPVASNVNISWVTSEEIWYFPFLTRSELLLWTQYAVNEDQFKLMSEEYAIENSCFHMNWKKDFDMFGFGKRMEASYSMHFNPVRQGAVDWEYKGEYGGTTYIIFTDNKSFAVGVDVFSDGSRGGYVMTPKADLGIFSEEQISEWKQKLVEVGFPEDSFVKFPTECAEKFWNDFKENSNTVGDKSADLYQTTASPNVILV